MHQQTSPPCPPFHLQLSVLHTDTDLHTCQTSTWRHISKFSTCSWHNRNKRFINQIHTSYYKKRNWKSKDLWLWMRMILDSYAIAFPKSNATGLPPASLRATKIHYFSTCTKEHSQALLRKNGLDYLLQKDASQVRHLLSTPPQCIACWKYVDVQWYLFSKQLLKSPILFQNVFLKNQKKITKIFLKFLLTMKSKIILGLSWFQSKPVWLDLFQKKNQKIKQSVF